jgi:hypothetical protein
MRVDCSSVPSEGGLHADALRRHAEGPRPRRPADILATFDHPPTAALSLLNVDLSTVTTAADLVIGLGDPLAEIVHFDFQASAAAWKHGDILAYQALLFREFYVPVHSIVVLLLPQAAHANLNGAINFAPRPGRGKMDFGYEVVRLWERPAADLLAGALGTAPLAMLGALPADVPLVDGLKQVAERLIERLNREVPPERARKLLTSAFVLTGLRVGRQVARNIFRGVRAMQESVTYLAILDEGREAELKASILLFGEQRFGPPGETVTARLKAITEDLERLRCLQGRIAKGTATNWDDLLDTP